MDESIYTGSKVITRYPDVILSKNDVPYASDLTFNAGIVRQGDGYIMLFRNDYGCTQPEWEAGKRFKGTNIGLARSKDGLKWQVEKEPVFELSKLGDPEFIRCYDPRITVLSDRYVVSFAIDTRHGVCGGFYETRDFKDYKLLSLSVPDNRNMVLFPEKINGNYVRLERPMPVYSRSGDGDFDIWLTGSGILGQEQARARDRGRALLQRQDRSRRPAAQDRKRLARHFPRRGYRPRPRQKRLGRQLEEALLHRHNAARPERPVQGHRHEQASAYDPRSSV